MSSNYRGEVFAFKEHIGDYKTWSIKPNYDGWIYLENNTTGLYLEGTENYLYAFSGRFKNDDDSQKWRIIGSFLIHKLTGKVLDSDRQGLVYLSKFTAGPSQYWIKYF